MIVKCNICGNDFVQKTYNQLYCGSLECKKKVKSIIARRDYEKHRERCILNAKKLRYIKKCKECGKEFKTYSKTILLCGKECQSIGLKRDRFGENNPAYRNGAYTKESNKLVHKKGDYKFQRTCREMNKEMLDKFGYRFCEHCLVNNSLRWEHHHIIFRSEKPGHINIHNKDNIINLCIKCHNEFHKKKSIRDPLVKERGLDKLFGLII